MHAVKQRGSLRFDRGFVRRHRAIMSDVGYLIESVEVRKYRALIRAA